MVEKVPDSTYEMVGGLDKQIKEIKEVIELPVKHPELFEALGIAQPKVKIYVQAKNILIHLKCYNTLPNIYLTCLHFSAEELHVFLYPHRLYRRPHAKCKCKC